MTARIHARASLGTGSTSASTFTSASTRLYRILRAPYATTPFDGEGTYRYGGRWSSPGTRLVYTSEHQSLAMLEYFVHLDRDDPPRDLVLATADIPQGLSRDRVKIKAAALPPTWREIPAPPELAQFGDEFARQLGAAILVVPSAISTSESNWLLNPAHPDFRLIIFHPAHAFAYDRRLLRSKK